MVEIEVKESNAIEKEMKINSTNNIRLLNQMSKHTILSKRKPKSPVVIPPQ